MTSTALIAMITLYATHLGFDPSLAVAVAKTESNLNPAAIGAVGEIGLFQIRPEYAGGYTIKDLKNPHVNTVLGIIKLKEAKERCKHKNEIDWLVCYNRGVTGGARVKTPKVCPYVKKVASNL